MAAGPLNFTVIVYRCKFCTDTVHIFITLLEPLKGEISKTKQTLSETLALMPSGRAEPQTVNHTQSQV